MVWASRMASAITSIAPGVCSRRSRAAPSAFERSRASSTNLATKTEMSSVICVESGRIEQQKHFVTAEAGGEKRARARCRAVEDRGHRGQTTPARREPRQSRAGRAATHCWFPRAHRNHGPSDSTTAEILAKIKKGV